jgi:hypothetical protein
MGEEYGEGDKIDYSSSLPSPARGEGIFDLADTLWIGGIILIRIFRNLFWTAMGLRGFLQATRTIR